MRALCGAIITAGALIGLGLSAIGVGNRYAMEKAYNEKGEAIQVKLHDMDRPLIFILVFLACLAIIGLGIAVAGLAYHHHRREREHHLERERAGLTRTPAV